jgi:predicted esterase
MSALENPPEFIHRFIPASGNDATPTLLLLHGTGGNENDLLPLGRALAPRAALLAPRGRVLENGMPRFFRRLAEGVFDLEDLTARTHELADFLAAAARLHGFHPGRVIAVGFSNGANVAASTLLLRPRALAGAVLFRPMVPLVPENHPDLTGVPVLIGAGRLDPIATPEHTERLATLLRESGAEVSVHWQPAGHTITEAEVAAAREWLARLSSSAAGS